MLPFETIPGLPCLASGHGMPGRQHAICDGRTSMRLDAASHGFDLLTHYAEDSWFALSRVLVGQARMTWSVDELPHLFSWMELYPFGYRNWESRDGHLRTSVCTIREGQVTWRFAGLRKFAEFAIPHVLFKEYAERRDDGVPLAVATWRFQATTSAWQATRDEEWLHKDSSTFAGIAGETIAEEPGSSCLHVVVDGSDLEVFQDEIAWRFRVRADRNGEAALRCRLSSVSEVSDVDAPGVAAHSAWQSQSDRYQDIAQSTPSLQFGRHQALQSFFRLQPGYLDSMRIAGRPGAFRANNDYYWVWGWDMTRPAFGLLTANRAAFVRELLDFLDESGYRNQYDNSLTRDLRAHNGQPGALEFMLMHDYLAWTGDLAATHKWRPAVESSLQDMLDSSTANGMLTTAAASTDFPEEFGRTFQAQLAYSSSWQFAGLCSAEKLLLRWGNAVLAAEVRALASRLRRQFHSVFWNDEAGFWNEGVHPDNPDLNCDVPLSTAMAGMDSGYGEDLYGKRLLDSARYASRHFLRSDGVHITCRGESRGWKEWTRQGNNWFAANDTMLARLFRAAGDIESLERLFYLYEMNFGYQPAAFEGKPFRRPLNTSGSWQAFGAGAWYRNVVEAAAGLWVDLGGLTLVPAGLAEPVTLSALTVRQWTVDFDAEGEGPWVQELRVDGEPLEGTLKLPQWPAGRHKVRVSYGLSARLRPCLLTAVDAKVKVLHSSECELQVQLEGVGYTPFTFFAPSPSSLLTCDDQPMKYEYDDQLRRGRARIVATGAHTVTIRCEEI